MADRADWWRKHHWYQTWNSAPNRKRLEIIWSSHRGLVVGAALLLAAGLAWWLAALGSWLLKHSEEVRNLMLSAGVIGAGLGVWVAFRRSQTERLRQVTDSFEGGVQLLGHEDRSVRMGAIYALERIARQNRDEHWPIMETLTAFVRDRASWTAQKAEQALDPEVEVKKARYRRAGDAERRWPPAP